MVPFAIFGILAIAMSTGVECGYSSASSSSSSNSDGSGHTYTQTNNNGQGQFVHTQNKPGGGTFTQTGGIPSNNDPGQVYGPANFGQPGFGFQYSPGFPYGSYGGNLPPYTPFPQQNFGFGAPFQPLPFQPIQPFSPFQPLATPAEVSAYFNRIQNEYAAFYKHQQELLNSWKNSAFQNGYGGAPNGQYNPNYAYATGSYNPNNGFHQAAGVFPPNKNKPNVDTRFDGSENGGGNVPGNAPGYFGIQTSSFSSSSDINGVKKHKEGASTTINDNGKVTTYNVEN